MITKTITKYIKLSIFIIININSCANYADVYTLLNDNNSLIGKNIEFIIPENNTNSLEFFSEKFSVGLRNILAVNPDIDLFLPGSKKRLIIPKQLILPNTVRSGIIINSAEMRLFYYHPNKNNTIIVFPISIGTIDHETPHNWITSIKYKKKAYLDPNTKYA